MKRSIPHPSGTPAGKEVALTEILSEHNEEFYIGGRWVKPLSTVRRGLVAPATGEAFAAVALGGAADVDCAVAAAKAAFPSFSHTTRAERLDLLRRVSVAYARHREDFARVMQQECGFPRSLAYGAQFEFGAAQFAQMIETLATYPFEERRGTTLVRREPIGVCALITPWNWPLNQIACKVAPALAAGDTVVLKPSELSPLNALVFAEVLDEAGVPPGVFNLVNGDGVTTGAALAAHPDIDMVSFTGSTRGGIAVAQTAAPTVKRVHQELGGKSPFVVLPDADLERAVNDAVAGCFYNTGQTCNAPTRLLVPAAKLAAVNAFAKAAVERQKIGYPDDTEATLGPVISDLQRAKIQRLIQAGIDEGATLVVGGIGAPEGFARGYFVRPTVFSNVTPAMTIFREEIFGPVLSISAYRTFDEAIRLANDTPYGLAGYVHGGDLEAARTVAAEIRAGTIYINSPAWDSLAPFGGFKASGNGREYADFAMADFTEIKGIVGYGAERGK